ncbi:MAG: Mur ligase family protein [Patescibacteria group bacterium]
MKKTLKKILPTKLLIVYHYFLAKIATIIYGFPAKKMIIIGVTGTKGKTSTINFIHACLQAGGLKTGLISTANIRIGQKEQLNKFHMTMPGRFTIQKLMKQMVDQDCRYCLVETTSEGLKQYRHIGVYYDIAVFTNLTPEHLPSHNNSFEKYRQAKLKMFKTLSTHKKIINNQPVEKIIIANSDSDQVNHFLKPQADKKITFGLNKPADYTALNIQTTETDINFSVKNSLFSLSLPGRFNIYNALPAIIIGHLANLSDQTINQGLKNLTLIPGRMEIIKHNQNFKVFVDYAHEKESLTGVLTTAGNLKKDNGKIIVLLGAEGGGRDKAKRPAMGEVAAKLADYIIVSNVDPYDDDPQVILEDIAKATEKFGKTRNQNLFVIEDRRQGINKALTLAQDEDVVIITGKGAEQSMIIGSETIPWDDRKVVREELEKIEKNK